MKDNLGLKIFALLAAILIWLQVALMSDHQSKVNLDLRILNAPVEDSLQASFRKVSCQVQGRGMDIVKLQLSKAYIEMEARDLRLGNYNSYTAKNVPPKLKLAILSVDPRPAKRQDKTPEGDPASAEAQANTGRKASEPGKSARADSRDPLSSIILPGVPISNPSGLRLFPAEATLKVQGKASSLASLPRGIVVSVDAKPDSRGLYGLNVAMPEGVTLLDITPQQVRLGK